MQQGTEIPRKAESWRMFDRIAATYDALNFALSAGIDRRWRRRVADFLPRTPTQLRLLDLATGTGDQLLAVVERESGRIERAVGADPSAGMLELARRKTPSQLLHGGIEWRQIQPGALPFADGEFDAVTMAFGIRNVPDPAHTLSEILRVLAPGGRAIILEFSLPGNPFVRFAYLLYFRRVLPWIGGVVSGDMGAYRYLNQTVEQFPSGADFLRLMKIAGFEECAGKALTFGIASIYTGSRK